MAFPDTVFLHDRIKEISHSTGAGNLSLDGAATGFGSFSGVYSSGDAIFYAITDGTNYEVGSGYYINDGSTDSIARFAFNSSNSNNNVIFNPGIKEVFVSYPGEFALFSAGGMDGFTQPDVSGMAFFGSQQTVDYSSNVIFDKNNNRIGIVQPAPLYSIDIGGTPEKSLMRSSGVIVAESGIIFSGVSPTHTSAYSGGIQLEPFMRNELDPTTGSNAIFSLSGLVDQRILLNTQVKGSVFAGPASGCIGAGCSPDYPTFRYLASEDIPDLSHLYTEQFVDAVGNVPYQGDITYYKESGVLDHDHFFTWDASNNRIGINRTDPGFTLDVDGDASISGNMYIQSDADIEGHLHVSGNVVISGNLDVQGDLTYIDSSTVTIWDKQLELASMSGTALYADSALDDAGIVIKSTNSDKKWTWHDSNDSWRTDEGVGASGHLEVSGHVSFGNDLLVANTTTVSGNLNVSGISNFKGDAYFVNDITTSGKLNVSGISIFNEDSYFTSNAPVVMSGTLGVSGAVDFDSTLNVDGVSTLNSTLDVDGATTLNNILDVDGTTALHSDLSVGGDVIVSGNLDIQGDVTYIDSSTVTIWDKQLELGSMSGTALYGDSQLDDAGIAIKSTNYDKKWTWRDSNDSWRTDEGIGASGLLEVSGHATLGNDLLVTNDATVSGLFNASGNSTFDNNVFVKDDTYTVGNATTSGMFNASGNSTFDGNITAQKQLFVTGDSYFIGATTTSGNLNISGVSIFNEDAYFTSNAPVVMSGTLGVSGAAQFDSTVDASGDVTLGNDLWVTNNATVSGTLGVSGIVSFDDTLHFRNNDIRIGVNAGLNYSEPSGGEGYRPINIGQLAGHLGSGNSTVNVGSQAGTQASGEAMTNVGVRAGYRSIDSLRLSNYGSHAGALSSGCWYSIMGGYTAGYAAENCDFSTFLGPYAGYYAGGSGLGQGLSYTLAVGSGAGYRAKGKHNVMVGGDCGAYSSGVDNIFIGVRAGFHTSGNNNLEISTCCDTLLPSGTVTSYKLNISETIVGDISTKRLAIGNVDATNLSPNATLEIVPSGTDVALLASGDVHISGNVLVDGNFTLLKFTDNHIRIGQDAGSNYTAVTSVYPPINIGKRAGYFGSGISTVNVGSEAGTQASGEAMTNVGVRAGYRSIDSLRLSTYGSHAGALSSGCTYSLMGGYTAGYASENCDFSTFLGPYAGSYAGGSGLGQGLSYTLAVGSGAGYRAKGKHNVMVGGDCGAFSSGVDNIFIGVRAGYHTSGNNNLEISTCCDTLMPSGTVTSYKLNISETIVGDISTKRLAIGNVNASHLSPNATLEVVPNGADVALLASGDISVSGTATLHGALETYSGGLPVNTIINSSGLLTIPIFASKSAVEAALPAAQHNKGVIAVGGNYFMVCNGTEWLDDGFN